MARKHVLAVLGAALALGAAVFATSAASQQTRPLADDPNNASLTYWYWGEDDAPGAHELAQEAGRRSTRRRIRRSRSRSSSSRRTR